MKKIKLTALIIMLVLIINIIMPTAFAVEEELNTAVNTNTVEDDQEDKTKGVEDIEIDTSLEQGDNEEIKQENEIKQEENKDLEDKILEEELKIEENTIKEVDENLSASSDFSIYVEIDEYKINTYLTNNIYYLFIPQGVDISNLTMNYTGNVTQVSSGTIDTINGTINNNFSQKDTIVITANNVNYTVKVMQSDLPSMSISLNGVTLSQINSGSKSTKYKNNSLVIKSKDNSEYDFSNSKVEIKGRGNYTWQLPKKSYQIKFDDKYNILGMNKAKTWILLANYMDNSYARNKVAFDFAKNIGLKYTPNYKFIDLWIDGEYLGNYMLVEKIQVAKNRVELNDDYGIIAELDNTNYQGEILFRSNTSKTFFTLKDSVADDTDETDSTSIAAFKSFENSVNEFEKYLYADNKDWNKITSMIDVESFIEYYFVQEFSEDPDGCRSSVFMYKDGTNDVIHMGPVWDYDSAFANYTTEDLGGNSNIDYIMNIQKYMEASNDWYKQLFTIKEFREKVIKIYNEKVKQSLENINNEPNANMIKSANMNDIVWKTLGKKSKFGRVNNQTYIEEVRYLNAWLQRRINYLNKRYSTNSDIYNINYETHVQDIGWQGVKSNGELAGTEGQSKRLEAIKINLDSFNSKFANAHINYQVHIQDIGWQKWTENGKMAGTEGQSKRLEGIRIKLEGAPSYTIMYRVHVQDYGWQDWRMNGEFAGTEGQSKRLEAIEIKIVKINYLGIDSPSQTAKINYSAHIQDIGWSGWGCDNEMIGTEGQSKRLEGIKISVNNKVVPNVNITYQVHVQDIGWQSWKRNGEFAGTEGQSKRLEAIKIKLDNSKYKVRYRTHIQNIGWRTMG